MWLAFSIRQKLMLLAQVTSQQTPTFSIYICVITLGSLFCVTVTETGFRITCMKWYGMKRYREPRLKFRKIQHIKLIWKLQKHGPILWIYKLRSICKESYSFTSTNTCTKMKLIQRLWKNSGWKDEHAIPCWCMRTTSPGSDDKLWIIHYHSLADVTWRILVCSEAVYAFITSQNRSWYDIRQCKRSKTK